MSDHSNGHRYDAEANDTLLHERIETHEEAFAALRTDVQDILASGREHNARICKLAERFHDFGEEQKRQGKLLEAMAAAAGVL